MTEENDEDTSEEQEWYEKHPLLSDSIFIVLPMLILSGSWFILTGDARLSVMQGVIIATAVILTVLYMERKYNRKVFRYIGK